MALIHEKIIALLADAGAVAKDQENKEQKFSYRGVDQVVNAINPLLKKHRVAVLPTKITKLISERFENANKKIVTDAVCVIEYTWIAEDGSEFKTEVQGQGRDFADKAVAKASSVAFRTLLLQSLALPTGDKDPDSESIEVSTAAPAKPTALADAQKSLDALKVEIANLLVEKGVVASVGDSAGIQAAGTDFFSGRPGWSNAEPALVKWRDALKGE